MQFCLLHYDGLFVVDDVVAADYNGIGDAGEEIVAVIVEMLACQLTNDDEHASYRQRVAARFANSASVAAGKFERSNLHYGDVENDDEWLGVYER